jgi:hypothetical protein
VNSLSEVVVSVWTLLFVTHPVEVVPPTLISEPFAVVVCAE